MAFTCPRCTQPLTSHRTASATIEGCLGCGGVFVDREGRNRVVAAKCADTAAASDLAAAHARHNPSFGPAHCPVCRKVMHVTRVAGGVELDLCDDHGAWFDRHELRRFIDALSAQQPKRAAKNVPVAAAAAVATVAVASSVDAEDVADAAEAGLTVLEIFGGILSALAD